MVIPDDSALLNGSVAWLPAALPSKKKHSLDPYNTKQHIPQSATARERKRTEANANERRYTRPVGSSSAERLAQNVSTNPSSTRDVRES